MKAPKDKFSKQAITYKKFRPTYPPTLFKYILTFVKEKSCCWDCGTGNGQVAEELANYFDEVYATDISKSQLANAIQRKNIFYSAQRAEQTNFSEATFDLITVAQALHWFDFKFFSQEVKRVLKPNGILAVWGYGLLRIDPEIDKIIDHFYSNSIGSYWNKERKYIDNAYQSIDLDLHEINTKENFSINTEWKLEHMEGYLNSWSSVQNYMEAKNENPVVDLIQRIKPLWRNSVKQVHFPIFLRIWKCHIST